MNQQQILQKIANLAAAEADVLVLWLYGSRANQSAHSNSDYDLAVAFEEPLDDVLDNRLRPEVLALKWQEILGVDISILDINLAAIPIAMSVVEANSAIYGQNSLRCYKEEQRIMSMWELDYQQGRQSNV